MSYNNNEKLKKQLTEIFNNNPDALKYFIEQGIIEPSECNETNQPLDSDTKSSGIL